MCMSWVTGRRSRVVGRRVWCFKKTVPDGVRGQMWTFHASIGVSTHGVLNVDICFLTGQADFITGKELKIALGAECDVRVPNVMPGNDWRFADPYR